jgi:hypothetical protein
LDKGGGVGVWFFSIIRGVEGKGMIGEMVGKIITEQISQGR